MCLKLSTELQHSCRTNLEAVSKARPVYETS